MKKANCLVHEGIYGYINGIHVARHRRICTWNSYENCHSQIKQCRKVSGKNGKVGTLTGE
jgi:hypothetical protein